MENDPNFRVAGKVAIVTGGAGRLGPMFVETLARHGARVIVADKNEKAGSLVAKKIQRQTKQSVLFLPVDLKDPVSVENLARSVFFRFRRIDILINAAMSVPKNFHASIENYSWEDWAEVMDVNVGGVFLCSRAVAKFMKRSKGGAIINLGSIYGVVAPDQRIYGRSGIQSPAVYAASKAAVIQLTKYLAVYWAPYGIRVNAISPGGIYMKQEKGFVRNYSAKSPMGRMVRKEELQGALLYLASPAASAVTGHNLLIDGGWTAW